MSDSPKESSLGTSVLISACVLAIAIATGSFLIKGSIDRGTARMGQVLNELESLSGKLAARGDGAPSAARPARPDPSRRYEVALGNAPTRGGPDSAKIKIVEWSDFQ